MTNDNRPTKEYQLRAEKMRDRLNEVGPGFCLSKWLMVTLHLTNGNTHSCHHPVAHPIPLDGLNTNPERIHNTEQKNSERRQMRVGKRPEGCSYCWDMEDAGHLSDRHFRSSEAWGEPQFERVRDGDTAFDQKILPPVVEVNFNQACNFKCIYCSPHLSSEWQKEVESFGPFQLSEDHRHHDLTTLKEKHLLPLGVPNSENPYVQAFWQWWPELYPQLKIFRMTGGEPLLDANTWKVLDYVIQNPKLDLELSVTSNFCPPKKEIFEKFLNYLQKIESAAAAKKFIIYVSCDSVGAQAEYIRTGMNFNILKRNILLALQSTQHTEIRLINTLNLLSLPGLSEFLKWVLDLRQKYPQRVSLDTPTLVYPTWLNVKMLGNSRWEAHVQAAIDFMKENLASEESGKVGFYPHEITRLERDLSLMKQGFDADTWETNHRKFVNYIAELDRRRGTDFVGIFPELTDFYGKPD